MYRPIHFNKVGKRHPLVIFIIILFFIFSLDKIGAIDIYPEAVVDNSFYGAYCQDPSFSWLCILDSGSLEALKEKDGWEITSQDFLWNGENSRLEFVFPSPENFSSLSSLTLKMALRGLGENLSSGRLWVDCAGNHYLVPVGGMNSWLIFNGRDSLEEEVDLTSFCQPLLSSWPPEEKIKITLAAVPILSSSPFPLLAIDELKIEARENKETVTLTPTPILTLTPTPTPALLTPTPTPTATLTPTPTLTPSAEESSQEEIRWLSPLDGETVTGRVVLSAASGDQAQESENWRFFYRPLGGSYWRRIEKNVWSTASLPLGRYQLRVEQKDGEGAAEITVTLGIKIFNIFLTEGKISWQTDRPCWGRVIYDRQAHSDPQIDWPNLGYLWASSLLEKKKAYYHQFTFPRLSPGRYFYRLLAIDAVPYFTQEYVLVAESLLLPHEGEKMAVLGATASSSLSLSPSPTVDNVSSAEGSLSAVGKYRLVSLIILGFLLGAVVFGLTKKQKKTLMGNNEK